MTTDTAERIFSGGCEVAHPLTTQATALRDRVMIEVLLGTGIRLGELAALDIDDINLDTKHLRIRAKGNVMQVKFIKTDLRRLLRRYLAERRRLGAPDVEALFLSNRGKARVGNSNALVNQILTNSHNYSRLVKILLYQLIEIVHLFVKRFKSWLPEVK